MLSRNSYYNIAPRWFNGAGVINNLTNGHLLYAHFIVVLKNKMKNF